VYVTELCSISASSSLKNHLDAWNEQEQSIYNTIILKVLGGQISVCEHCLFVCAISMDGLGNVWV
jgi:hypothetical protein